jgi:hypothetical protein
VSRSVIIVEGKRVIFHFNEFCGHELVVLYKTTFMFGKFLVVVGEVLMKDILYRAIEGQNSGGMPSGTEMSLTLNEPI